MDMPVVQYTSIAILAVAFFSQFWKINISRAVMARRIFWGAVLLIAFLLGYYSYLQYHLWQSGAFTKIFLSDGAAYFLSYVTMRFWAQYFVSFGMALVFFWMAKNYNRRQGEKFFYPEEPYFLALGIFLAGQPLWIVYILAVIVLYTFFSIGYNLWSRRRRKTESTDNLINIPPARVSFYYGWIPTALLVILIKGTITAIPLFSILVFSANQLII